MSTVDTSTTSGSPPPEAWAGKSRNAKAQARHRAKRKAYIEQLEQTVSKLQTALALSSDDVANLPTTQMKLRQLRDENDTLRAELRKLQMQSSSGYRDRIPHQMLSPASSEEHLRQPKKRKVSPALADEYVARDLQAYLGPDDATGDTAPLHHTDSLQSLHISVPPLLPQQEQFHMQPHLATASQPSPISRPSASQSRDAMFPWRPFSYPEGSMIDSVPMSWPFPTHSNHQRQRSSSASSASSMPDEPYLAQPRTPVQMSLRVPYKESIANGNGARYDPTPKREDYLYPNVTESSTSYGLTQAVPLSATEDSVSSATSDNSAWSDGAWSYSAVRMQ